MTLFEHRDRIINEIIKPIFKEDGFRVSGITFKKSEKDFIKIFNIQSSSFNSEVNISFYLNIGFLFPIWFEFREQQLPKLPKESDCLLRIRTDSLTGRNQWYEIKQDTDIEELEQLISNDIKNYVLPFYKRYVDLEDCLNLSKELPKDLTDCEPYIGLTFIKNGEIEKGNKILDEFLPKTLGYYWHKELNDFRLKLIEQTTKPQKS